MPDRDFIDYAQPSAWCSVLETYDRQRTRFILQRRVALCDHFFHVAGATSATVSGSKSRVAVVETATTGGFAPARIGSGRGYLTARTRLTLGGSRRG